jgi:hypothetical protein
MRQQTHGARVTANERELLRLRERPDRHEHAAHRQRRQHADRELDAVLEQGQHPVARGDAVLEQPLGQGPYPAEQLLVPDPLAPSPRRTLPARRRAVASNIRCSARDS